MPIESVTDLRNTDAGQTAFTVRQNPVGGSTACHAVQVTQAATSGDSAAINVVSNNTTAAVRVRGAGTLLELKDSTGATKFSVSQTGTLTSAGQDLGGAAFLNVGTTADRKSTRLNSSHQLISYAVFC